LLRISAQLNDRGADTCSVVRPGTPEHFFTEVAPKLVAMPERREAGGHATFVFRLSGSEASEWTLDLRRGKVHRGAIAKAEMVVEMDSDDFSKMMRRELDVSAAMTDGRIKWQGEIEHWDKLAAVFSSRTPTNQRQGRSK
jgi:putative sterol carrier protein